MFYEPWPKSLISDTLISNTQMSHNPITQNDLYERIYRLVQQVPHGHVTTYGAIAKHIGAASKARLVGYALNRLLSQPTSSPFSDLTVPAHRVVNRQGICTGRRFFPGNSMIERLEQEGVVFIHEDQVDLKAHFWDTFVEPDSLYAS